MLVADVAVDVGGLDREFSYLVPDHLVGAQKGKPPTVGQATRALPVGTVVQVPLGARKVRGWVTGLREVEPDGEISGSSRTERKHQSATDRPPDTRSDGPTEAQSSTGRGPSGGQASHRLLEIASVVGAGPPPHVVELARWAAGRWLGTFSHFLRAATGATPLPSVAAVAAIASQLPALAAVANQHEATTALRGLGVGDEKLALLAVEALGVLSALTDAQTESTDPPKLPGLTDDAASLAPAGPMALRAGPCADWWSIVAAGLVAGRTVVVAPSVELAHRLAARAAAAGVSVAAPGQWEQARSAQLVVGARSAVWCPAPSFDAVVVLDEQSQLHQSSAAPTWNARDVALQRAQLDGAACLLVSPAHSPEALTVAPRVVAPAASAERRQWARIELVDRRNDDPTAGEWCSPRVAALLAATEPAQQTTLFILNRTGRARLAICTSCGELARSPITEQALVLDGGEFTDTSTGDTRPAVCAACGALRFRRARLGVKGVAAEIEAFARAPVEQVVGPTKGGSAADSSAGRIGNRRGLFIGTEAALHRAEVADHVVFLDFDQELLAPRYRAAEEAMELLVRASALVGSRDGAGRVLVQTRMPDASLLRAAVDGCTGEWSAAQLVARRERGQPPASTWVLVSGAGAEQYVEAVRAELDRVGVWKPGTESDEAERGATARPQATGPRGSDSVLATPPHAAVPPIDITRADDATWRLRSAHQEHLLEVLRSVPRPKAKLRVAVDPMRV